jgi:hypothetical protein
MRWLKKRWILSCWVGDGILGDIYTTLKQCVVCNRDILGKRHQSAWGYVTTSSPIRPVPSNYPWHNKASARGLIEK